MTSSTPPRTTRRKPAASAAAPPLNAAAFTLFHRVIELAVLHTLGAEPMDLDPLLTALDLTGPLARHVVLECLGELRRTGRIEFELGQGWCLPRTRGRTPRTIRPPPDAPIVVTVQGGAALGTTLPLPPWQIAAAPEVVAKLVREAARDPLAAMPREFRPDEGIGLVAGVYAAADTKLRRLGVTLRHFLPKPGAERARCYVLFSASEGDPTTCDRWVQVEVDPPA